MNESLIKYQDGLQPKTIFQMGWTLVGTDQQELIWNRVRMISDIWVYGVSNFRFLFFSDQTLRYLKLANWSSSFPEISCQVSS